MKAAQIAALIGAVALGAACSTIKPADTIHARLVDASGGSATPLEMEFVTDTFGMNGMMTVTMPSGEVFRGRYAQISSTSGSDTLGTAWGGWGVWEPYWKDWGPHGSPWVSGDDFATFVQNYSGKVVATLFGDRGGTMRCRFQLADPGEGLAGGAVGQCQTSSGHDLEAQI